MTIDTKLLNSFLMISESKNLNDAAHKANLTQSAISQGLKRLEEDLGVQLVVRHATPVQLTPAGTVLKQGAEIILSDLRRLRAYVREASEKGLKHCRLGLITSISEIFGSQLIVALKDHTEKLTLRSGLRVPLIESYLQKKIDILISDDPLIDLEGVERFKILRDPMLMAISEKLVKPGTTTVEEIYTKVPLISYGPSSQIGRFSTLVQRRMRIQTTPLYETDETHTMIKFIKEGHGWGMLTALCLAQGLPRLEGLKILELDKSRHARNIYLLSPEQELGETPKLVVNTILNSFHNDIYWKLKNVISWLTPELFLVQETNM